MKLNVQKHYADRSITCERIVEIARSTFSGSVISILSENDDSVCLSIDMANGKGSFPGKLSTFLNNLRFM